MSTLSVWTWWKRNLINKILLKLKQRLFRMTVVQQPHCLIWIKLRVITCGSHILQIFDFVVSFGQLFAKIFHLFDIKLISFDYLCFGECLFIDFSCVLVCINHHFNNRVNEITFTFPLFKLQITILNLIHMAGSQWNKRCHFSFVYYFKFIHVFDICLFFFLQKLLFIF